MDRTVRLEIRGLVQGVGFRWSLAARAGREGVDGWVRNRRDGSVEAVARGTAGAVERLIAWARSGPPGAVVDSVEVVEMADAAVGAAGFEQRPTA